MEFVGKIVRKEFSGQRVFTGIVQSYDASSGFFEILYEDGDSEELDFSQVASLLQQREVEPAQPKRGRPKKRRRLDLCKRGNRGDSSSGNSYCNSPVVETLGKQINGNFDLNHGFVENPASVDLNGSVNCGLKEVLDLNAGFNLNLNEGFDLNDDGEDVNVEKKSRECIDLNLDVNGDVDENTCKDLGTQKRERGFDLNLGIDEEIKDVVDEGQVMEITSIQLVKGESLERIPNDGSSVVDGTLQEVHVTDDMHVQFAKGIWKKGTDPGNEFGAGDSVEVQGASTLKEDSPEVINENQGENGSAYKEESGGGLRRGRRGRRKKTVDDDGLNSTPETAIFTDAKVTYGNQDDISCIDKEENSNQKRRRRGRPVGTFNSRPDAAVIPDAHHGKQDCNMVTNEKQGEVAGSHRKRRKVSDIVNATPEMTVLRRSTRRGAAKNDVLTAVAVSVVNDLSVSPAVSALTEEKPVKSCCEWQEEPVVLPAKAQLPPSSQNFDLGGISVADVFSVYACLRSFSTLLFLSPFELEEFVAALKSNYPSSLFDNIHVSILQTLKRHLECLSNEGSESASNCLRSLNWGFLDSITWPVFMVEYLLIHGSELKPGFNLSDLKLLKTDYYKQPVSLKVEILRYMCDDMIEVETIRSELNRRSSGSESELDFDRNINFGALKKSRSGVDVSNGLCLTEDAVDDTDDWNSDECCLCKMDGNLICCDGCPAAYHSKCVGVVSDALPEGDWFCPECTIDRHKPWMKTRKSLRGAELLGVDPYGRLYFSSCGYLLVSDSCEAESPFNYYHSNDLSAVIEVLRSSEMIYGTILEAILKHWDVPVSFSRANSNLGCLNHGTCVKMSGISAAMSSLETGAIKNETTGQKISEENFVTGCSGHNDVEVSKSANQTCVSSEGSETTQTSLQNQNSKGERPDCSIKSTNPTCLDSRKENVLGPAANGYLSSALKVTNMVVSQLQPGNRYMNHYSFGHIASSVAEDLLHKSSDKALEASIKSEEEIVSAQMKIISRKCAKFHWPNVASSDADVQKEKCGWCFSCRVSSDDPGCLFKLSLGPLGKESATEMAGLQAKRNKQGHLIDIIGHVLVIESQLQGLLSGPWLNAHYSKLWRKSVLKASDIESVKCFLLMLESNINRLALSAEWLKHVDSSTTMGSACHIVIASSRTSSKNGISKKRARCSEFDSNTSSGSSSGLSMLWWRGGRLSRRLFRWKALPRSLASKAARQAGGMKISGMLYPENSDFAKRSKYIAWRAAVELSTTVEQLALQVRELDSNIRWDEIRNTNPVCTLDKESKKSIRLFKKAIVRRKCTEAERTKYLLDFGKRRCIPDVVLKFGSAVEESSSERKKFWLYESYVPLYLLKNFEEKRIARRASKVSPGKLSDPGVMMKKPLKKSGFSYLFAKVDRSEYHKCGHCNKDVPIREAVCCRYCKGFFHKRHSRKSAGTVSANCEYTCHRCVDGKYMKIDSKAERKNTKRGRQKGSTKAELQKSKKASVGSSSVPLKSSKKTLRSSRLLGSRKNKKVTVVPLRRSPRKAKLKSMQNKKGRGRKKGKQAKPKKTTAKKPTKCTSWRKKRTHAHHSYWLNGLLLTRKPDDERVMQFRRRKFLAPSESVIHDQPKCNLCLEAGYTSNSSYVACEMCGEWFHGDAFGLDAENSNKIIGFRCHMCRNSTPPVCPFVSVSRNHGSPMVAAENCVANDFSDGGTNVVQQSMEINLLRDSLANKGHESSHLADGFACGEDGQHFLPDSRLKTGDRNIDNNLKKNTNAIEISNEDLILEPISCDENLMSEENTIKSGDDMMEMLHDQTQVLGAT